MHSGSGIDNEEAAIGIVRRKSFHWRAEVVMAVVVVVLVAVVAAIPVIAVWW